MGRIVFILFFLTSLTFFAIVGNLNAQAKGKRISSIRFGAGIGYTFLTTKGMDYRITRDLDNVNELRPSAILSVQKVIAKKQLEIGAVLRHGETETLLSYPGLGSGLIFDELQLSFQWSLNQNIALNKARFTFNFVAGLGLNNFKSKYFYALPGDTLNRRVISTVGYPRTSWDVFQKNRQNAFVGSFGYALGFRLTKQFSMYWETSYNLASTTKMKGDLSANRGGFADGYLFTSLGLYLRIQPPPNKLKCPRLK